MPGILIDVDLKGLDPLLARLEFAPFVLDQEAGRAMEDATHLVQDAVQGLTPVETGYLRASVSTQTSVYFSEIQGRVFTRVSYAPYVEEGHGEILPKHTTASGKPGFLRFRPKGSLDPVYARRVRPVAGVYMFRRGLEVALPAVVDRFRDVMRKVARAIAA
jgi:hypothetical protein